MSNNNLWLIRPESVEKSRPRNVFFWLSSFRRAVDDRKRALLEEGAAPIEDLDEAERLADERAQKIVTSHLLQDEWLCKRLGVPFDVPPGGAGYRESG